AAQVPARRKAPDGCAGRGRHGSWARARRGPVGLQTTLVLALLFALAVAGFAVQNAEPITVRFLQWEARTSLVVVILGAAAVGALSVGLAGGFRQLRTGWRVRHLQTTTQRLQQELEQVRTALDVLQAQVHELRQQ